MTLDATTVIGTLLAILIALSGWTLATVHSLATANAARDEKDKAQDVRIDENRSRIIDAEDKLGDLQVELAALHRKN